MINATDIVQLLHLIQIGTVLLALTALPSNNGVIVHVDWVVQVPAVGGCFQTHGTLWGFAFVLIVRVSRSIAIGTLRMKTNARPS
mmetsp:Transcript_31125/g.75221  ORF Transcript_31125/g.75221 Transcript_31125/m.75221 type:complete len:85 (-) Transcript_31125:241-495(-)